MSRRDGIGGGRPRLAQCVRLAARLAVVATAGGLLAPTGASAAEPLTQITIGKAVDTIPFTVIDVAIAQGFFKKRGLSVKEELLQGSSSANAAMVGGSLQFTCEAAVPLLLARAHGVPIMAVDALDSGVTLQFLASKQWLAKHPPPPNATFKQKMADLNGSVFAQVGTTDLAFYELLRGWADLPKTTGFRVEGLNSLAAVTVAMQRGIVDVTVQSPPQSVQLEQNGLGDSLIKRGDVPQFENVAYDILTTTTAYAKQSPAIVSKAASAVAEGLDFIRDHPDETLAIEQKHFPKLDKEVLRKSLQLIPFAKDGLQSQEAWNKAVSLAEQTGVVKGVKNAPEGDYWTNKFVDKTSFGH